jgi:hypothetical protein
VWIWCRRGGWWTSSECAPRVATVAVAASASGAQGPTAKAGLTVGERAFPFTVPLVLPSLSYYEMLRWNIVRDVAVSLVPIYWFHTSICSDSVTCPSFLMSPSRKSALSVSKAWITFVNLDPSLKTCYFLLSNPFFCGFLSHPFICQQFFSFVWFK